MESSSHGPEYPETNFTPGAKWVKSITKDRLNNFVGGRFATHNLSAVLFTQRLDDSKHVYLEVWSAPGRTKPSFEEAMKNGEFKPAKKGDSFGPSWTNHWWKVCLNIPSSWTKYERVQFEFDPGCEAMIWSADGTPLQGITGGYGGDRRVDFIVPPAAVEKGQFDFVIESSCNGMFGVGLGDTIAPPDENRYFTLASADLVVPNQEAWRLLWDFECLKQMASDLPGNSALQNQALSVANKIINTFRVDDPDSITRCRKIAEEVFGEGWDEKAEKIYDTNDKVRVPGIGYCHIDTAWLWPYSVTQQKVARSWSTQVDLMERYPEHRFTCSSAQQYKWLEQLYPSLFERVKEKVESGQFQPVGGSWVENDGNLPSGEALVRQFTYGQRYFLTRFGKRCESAWLPDSFGYPAAYPQIIRGCEMKYFFTQKLSWNNINSFPHSTFNWVAIDGTQVLTHMTPVDTYTAQATFSDVQRAVKNHKNLESTDTGLLVFGNGDGGGGPLSKMLENLRRVRAAGNISRDVPIVGMGGSVDDFFKDLERDTKAGSTLPVWHGELYFEFHRGTYTSHGSIKRGNRKSEILMRDLEHVATFASLHDASYAYPKAGIDECWEKVLLNQFHDVLPGSSIAMVYDDAEKLYAEVAKAATDMIEEALEVLLGHSIPLLNADLIQSKARGSIIGLNTTPFPRREVIELPLTKAYKARFKPEVVQVSQDKSKGYILVDGTRGAGLASATGMYAEFQPASAYRTNSGDFVLRNSNVEMKISDGRIVSLFDVELERELIPKGLDGGMVIFDDRPNYWDAWDVELHHLETPHPLKFNNIRIASAGPVRAAIDAEVSWGQSTISVTISLDAITATMSPNSRSLIRFDADVDWQQKHEFLKFEIPLNIRSDTATYECQFGNIKRPTHHNTTWETAKFEVCGHKYADLSEYGYGVALLNESKYGYSTTGNIMRLSLLRAATAPDAHQDEGKHQFSWALLPHFGHFMESDVPVAAYLFNSPMHLRYALEDSGSHLTDFVYKTPFLVDGSAKNVILETIKRGDDDEFGKNLTERQTIVLRMYEAYGGAARVKLRISSKVHVVKATLTNMLEDDLETLETLRGEGRDDADDTILQLDFRAFQIVTIKLTVEPPSASESPTRVEGWIKLNRV